ncbi:MAG: dihydrolipoyl dehydrogenase [Candidatus Dormibacteraceae bacterium]
MSTDRFDVAILGGGTGGYTAAIRAAQLGKRVALVEANQIGGCCLHQGCIPTKALLESASFYHRLTAQGKEFGVKAESVSFEMEQISTRRDKIVEQLYRGVQGLMKKNKIEVIQAPGRLANPGLVQAGERLLQATAIIIATGSTPAGLPGIEFDDQQIINSDFAVRSRSLPKSVAIIGAGAIGVEFATFYHQLGVKVTLLEALDRLVPLEDEEVSQALLQSFQRSGIDCRLGARVASAQAAEGRVQIELNDGRLEAEQLLVAVGRRPRSQDIGLAEAGVDTDQRGFIKVDEWMRTTAPGIWAIGDVIGGYLLAHAAAHEGVIAVEDIAEQRVHPMKQELVTRCTYSTPEIASVGLSEAQAVAAGHRVKVGKFPFAANGRAIIHGETAGFAKVVAEAESGALLGTHLIGIQATELIAEPALGQLFEADAWELARNIHPHPTLSEVIGEAALAASGKALNI